MVCTDIPLHGDGSGQIFETGAERRGIVGETRGYVKVGEEG